MINPFSWLIPQVQAQLTNPAIDPGLGGTYVSGNTEQAFGDWVLSLSGIILTLGAILFLFYLIWGGIDWITAGGDSKKIENARNKILQSIIGLIVLSSAYAIFFVVTNLLGVTSTPSSNSTKNNNSFVTGGKSSSSTNSTVKTDSVPNTATSPSPTSNTGGSVTANFTQVINQAQNSSQPLGDAIQTFINQNISDSYDDWVDVTINLSGGGQSYSFSVPISGKTTDSGQKIENEIISRISEMRSQPGVNSVSLSRNVNDLDNLSAQELLDLTLNIGTSAGNISADVTSISVAYRQSGPGVLKTVVLN